MCWVIVQISGKQENFIVLNLGNEKPCSLGCLTRVWKDSVPSFSQVHVHDRHVRNAHLIGPKLCLALSIPGLLLTWPTQRFEALLVNPETSKPQPATDSAREKECQLHHWTAGSGSVMGC